MTTMTTDQELQELQELKELHAARVMSNGCRIFLEGITCTVCKKNRACWVLHHATNGETLRVCNETQCRYAYASYTMHSRDNTDTSCDKCIHIEFPRLGDKLCDAYFAVKL